MRKIFCTIFLFFLCILPSFASNDIKIISRSEWGADESIRYIDSPEWQQIIKERLQQAKIKKEKVYTEKEIEAQKKEKQKQDKINEIVNKYLGENSVESKIYTENGKKLAWPITKVKKIRGIVVHHTATNYATSLESVRTIYKYHTVSRQWGDIGYNFLIGYDGEIFEGRAGGETSVAAHLKYNNYGTIGIAIIGDYTNKEINEKQYTSLKKLTEYLVAKYDIDLNKKTYFHEDCVGKSCGLPLTTQKLYPIIGHRDSGHTSCPGEELYAHLGDFKKEVALELSGKKVTSSKGLNKAFEKIGDEKLITQLANIEYDLDTKKDLTKVKLRTQIMNYLKSKEQTEISGLNTNKIINVKLSYPDNDTIKIKSGKNILEVTRNGNSLYIKGHKFNFLKIPKSNKNDIVEISSWERIPEWDKDKVYNDNKFRGDIILYVKNGKLIVVNSLYIEDYLKGLGEVSDYENSEKIKTVITAARSYAVWYTTQARKFPGEFYDGSDDPDTFQRYLGYGLEERSPHINKIVSETKGKVITYNGELIKPWYFSNSNGKTMSYYDYCMTKYDDGICKKEAKNYPYLQSVVDKASIGKTTLGHGVGISGAGVKYFAEKGWTYDLIIKYYLKGVDVK